MSGESPRLGIQGSPGCTIWQHMGSPQRPCHRPGASRAWLAGMGGAAAGAGAWWFLVGGDSYQSGDPAGQAIGVGLVAVGGAALGSLTSRMSGGRESIIVDRPARPTARIRMGLGGADALDETRPLTWGVALDPTLQLTDRIQLQPHLGYSPPLFASTDVDPRPQLEQRIPDSDSTFVASRTLRNGLFSVGAEGALRIVRTAMKEANEAYRPRFELRVRPTLEVRTRALNRGQRDEQRLQHTALYPLNVGFRWHVTPRQRFTAFVGPRIDWTRISPPGSRTLGPSGPSRGGPMYAEAYYQIDTPLSRAQRRNLRATGRFNLGYIHSRLDGRSFDTGAIIGFFGPVDVSYDIRLRPRGSDVATQFTAGSWLGTGGGGYLQVGAVLGGGAP